VDTWLLWNLTSGKRHITDRTNASRTLLYNIVHDQWDEELLRLLRVPRSMMPEVVWSSEKLGPVSTTLGLEGVEIAGIAGDQQSALFGQMCTPSRRCQEHLRHRLLSACSTLATSSARASIAC
jgi:glycerol kinase